jgi:hypothetical protein
VTYTAVQGEPATRTSDQPNPEGGE